jgi:hypothetical protein
MPMNKFEALYRIIYGKNYLLPICDIFVLGRNKRIPCEVLIDTGADYSILPLNVATDAGFEIPERLNYRVDYGSSKTHGVKIKTFFEIGPRRLSADFLFVERLDFPYGLLGRITLFNQFNEISFCERLQSPKVEFQW